MKRKDADEETEDPEGRNRMEETLQFGTPDKILAEGLAELLSFYPYCTRCTGHYHGHEGFKRRDLVAYGFPVCFRDSKGETCYEHAEKDAVPLPNWQSILFASIALTASGGYIGRSDESTEAAFATRWTLPTGTSTRAAFSFNAGLRFYAAKRGDDEDAESYASGVIKRSMVLGLMSYAAASGDPEIRPAWVVKGFGTYCKLRWPKDGDKCHECKQPMHADPASEGRRRKAESVKCRNPECRKNKKVDPDEVRRLIQDKLAEKRRKK